MAPALKFRTGADALTLIARSEFTIAPSVRFPPLREGNLQEGACVNSARAIGIRVSHELAQLFEVDSAWRRFGGTHVSPSACAVQHACLSCAWRVSARRLSVRRARPTTGACRCLARRGERSGIAESQGAPRDLLHLVGRKRRFHLRRHSGFLHLVDGPLVMSSLRIHHHQNRRGSREALRTV